MFSTSFDMLVKMKTCRLCSCVALLSFTAQNYFTQMKLWFETTTTRQYMKKSNVLQSAYLKGINLRRQQDYSTHIQVPYFYS